MSSTAFSAYNTLLKREDPNNLGTFVALTNVTSIEIGGIKLDTTDVTNMQSPGSFKEKAGTLLDGGTVTCEIDYVPTDSTHKGLLADQASKIRRNFQIVFPDGFSSTWAFSALVESLNPTAKVGDVLKAKVQLVVSGSVTTP